MAEIKLPTMSYKELGEQGARYALDKVEYEGLTIRQWADKITGGEYAPAVHGRWIYHDFDTICSECRKSAIFDEWEQQAETEFCPHCGAKMDEEVDSRRK